MSDVVAPPSIPEQILTNAPGFERHYTVPEISKIWNLSDDVVRRIFANEPGVLKFGEGTRLVGRGKYRRRYRYIRIPESVLQRVRDRFVLKAVTR